MTSRRHVASRCHECDPWCLGRRPRSCSLTDTVYRRLMRVSFPSGHKDRFPSTCLPSENPLCGCLQDSCYYYFLFSLYLNPRRGGHCTVPYEAR